MYICTRQIATTRLLDIDAAEIGRLLGRDRNASGGRSVSTWAATFGPPIGSVRWCLHVEHLADLQDWVDTPVPARMDSAAADDDPRHCEVTIEVTDDVVEVLTQTDAAPSTGFLAITTARSAPGCSSDAMAWGSDLTRLLTRLVDRPITYVRTMFGPAIELGWHIGLADLDDVERIDRLVTTDPEWIESTGDGGTYFLPGSFAQRLWRNLG